MSGMEGFINFNGTLQGGIEGGGGGDVTDVTVRNSQETTFESVVNEEGVAEVDLISYVRRNELTQAIENIENSIDNVEQLVDTKQNIINYSTDEQVIGTWFGKPLYQKIIRLQNQNFTTAYGAFYRCQYDYSTDFPTSEMMFVDLDNSYLIENYQDTEYYRSMVFYELETDSNQNERYLELFHRGSYLGVDIILTVRYTKTTD